MATERETTVLVIGAGPVGMVLAMELKSRGVDVILVERRNATEMWMARCNTVASRSMEIFRRIGVADKVRAVGLPEDFPNDVAWQTRGNGLEIARLPLPSRRDRPFDISSANANWPTPEPLHRASQLLIDPVLMDHVRDHWGIEVLNRTEFLDFVEEDDGVVARVRPAEGGAEFFIRCRYMVGCDGGRSSVRRQIGARLHGDDELYRSSVLLIRAPWMRDHIKTPPAWMTHFFGPGPLGMMIAINGDDLWLVHVYLPANQKDFASIDSRACVRQMLSVPPELDFDILHVDNWIARRLIADKFNEGRVFICGDAAHLWPPFGGHGMNTGIADANNLGWLLAAACRGWADPAILDSYEAERQPVTDQVSRLAMEKVLSFVRSNSEQVPPPEYDMEDEVGRRVRAEAAARVLRDQAPQYATKGLNYAYYYDRSPIVVYDGEEAPTYDMGSYTPSTVPGCRLAHFFTADGKSVYDLMGPAYTLLRFDPAVPVEPLLAAARARNLPLELVDLPPPGAPYRHKLVLGRADQMVAWRGDTLPADPAWFVDLIRGAAIGRGERAEAPERAAAC